MSQDHEMAGSIAGLCFIACFVIIILAVLTGCVEHRHTLPQLDTALEKIHSLTPLVKCRKVAEVPPLPGTVHIDMTDGQLNALDTGGDTVIRGYAACRSAYLAAP